MFGASLCLVAHKKQSVAASLRSVGWLDVCQVMFLGLTKLEPVYFVAVLVLVRHESTFGYKYNGNNSVAVAAATCR